jgi:hypothetical protein
MNNVFAQSQAPLSTTFYFGGNIAITLKVVGSSSSNEHLEDKRNTPEVRYFYIDSKIINNNNTQNRQDTQLPCALQSEGGANISQKNGTPTRFGNVCGQSLNVNVLMSKWVEGARFPLLTVYPITMY